MVEVVYGILIGERLAYIGRTNNFARRKGEHLRNIYSGQGAHRFRLAFRRLRSIGQWHRLDFVILFDGSPEQVRKKERELILMHRPPANTEFLDQNHHRRGMGMGRGKSTRRPQRTGRRHFRRR